MDKARALFRAHDAVKPRARGSQEGKGHCSGDPAPVARTFMQRLLLSLSVFPSNQGDGGPILAQTQPAGRCEVRLKKEGRLGVNI